MLGRAGSPHTPHVIVILMAYCQYVQSYHLLSSDLRCSHFFANAALQVRIIHSTPLTAAWKLLGREGALISSGAKYGEPGAVSAPPGAEQTLSASQTTLT